MVCSMADAEADADVCLCVCACRVKFTASTRTAGKDRTLSFCSQSDTAHARRIHGYRCASAVVRKTDLSVPGACENLNNVKFLTGNRIAYPAACVVVIYDLSAHTQRFYRAHDDDCICLAVDSSREIACSGQVASMSDTNPPIYVWTTGDLKTVAKLQGFHKRRVTLLQFSPTGQYIASVGGDDAHSVAVYDWRKQSCIFFGAGHLEEVYALAFNPHDLDEFLQVGGKHVKFWSFESEKSMMAAMRQAKNMERGWKQAEPQIIYSCTYTAEGAGTSPFLSQIQLLFMLLFLSMSVSICRSGPTAGAKMGLPACGANIFTRALPDALTWCGVNMACHLMLVSGFAACGLKDGHIFFYGKVKPTTPNECIYRIHEAHHGPVLSLCSFKGGLASGGRDGWVKVWGSSAGRPATGTRRFVPCLLPPASTGCGRGTPSFSIRAHTGAFLMFGWVCPLFGGVRARTHARTRARARTHTHTHTHTLGGLVALVGSRRGLAPGVGAEWLSGRGSDAETEGGLEADGWGAEADDGANVDRLSRRPALGWHLCRKRRYDLSEGSDRDDAGAGARNGSQLVRRKPHRAAILHDGF